LPAADYVLAGGGRWQFNSGTRSVKALMSQQEEQQQQEGAAPLMLASVGSAYRRPGHAERKEIY
jgi:hypothetical protein